MMNKLKKINANKTTDTSSSVQKLTMTQKLMKLKKSY